MKSSGPLFLRADANDTVILVSQSLADYLGVEKHSLVGGPLESVSEMAAGELRECFRRAESGRRLDQLVVDGSSRVFEAKTWSEGGVFDVLLDEVTSIEPVLDELRDSSFIPTDDLSEEEMATIRRPDRRTVSVFSARLVSFSEFIGRMTPIEVRLVIGSFTDEAAAAIPEFGGVLVARSEEFYGGIFGAPRSFADHALRALNAALRLSAAMETLRKSSSDAGREFPMVACGLATGECLVGTFGTSGASHYSALGAAPDIAQQLASLARPGEVLITESCLRHIFSRLPEGWTFEEFVAGEAPDLSHLRWSGDEVQPLPSDKQMRGFVLRSANSGSGLPEFAFHYIWCLRPSGTDDAVPVLCAEVPCASRAELDVSDTREESSFIQIFGKYQLVKLVGSGGMGKVWKARDRFGNTVALKTLHESGDLKPEQIRRFQREAEVMSRLSHRNICRIYEAGEFERIQYLTMEFVDGLSLADLLVDGAATNKSRKTGASDLQTIIRKVRSDIASAQSREASETSEPEKEAKPASRERLLLPVEQALALFVKVCEAVQFAHEHGILHRDLKPGNILLREDGEPLVADFGLAKFTGENDGQSISVSGHVLGTVANMAPEQATSSKDVDERADLYALGTILYILLTGKTHFQTSGNFFADLQRLREYTPPSARSVNLRVDPDMDLIIAKCLRANPDDRYRSVQALINDLGLYRRGEPVSARRISPVEHAIRWTKRHRAATAAALATLALVVGGTALGFFSLSQRARESELSRAKLEAILAERDEATRRSELVTEERINAEKQVTAAEKETADERILRQNAEAALKNEATLRKEAEARILQEKKLRELAEARIVELDLPKGPDETNTPESVANSENDLIEIQGGVLPLNAIGSGQAVPDFQIGISEVTWADWKAIRDASIALGYDLAGVGQGEGDNCPVTSVSWLDAVKWCNAKSQMDGLTPVYTSRGAVLKSGNLLPDQAPEANGYRLPTVLEWEWAARGGTKSANYKFSGSNNPETVMWSKENAAGLPQSVKSKAPNELGIFDMSGNVRELCWDQQKGNLKPLLGGCFVHPTQSGELSAKPLSEPIRRVINVGFRLARNAPNAPEKADETPLAEAGHHILSTKMDARNQEMLAIDSMKMEWSMRGKTTGWLYFSARSNQPVWIFSPCSKTDLKKISLADLQGDFVQKGENAKIQALFDPDNSTTSKGWNGNAIPVRENQIVIARNLVHPEKAYVIQLVNQLCESGKEQIGADYIVITSAPLDLLETAARENNEEEANALQGVAPDVDVALLAMSAEKGGASARYEIGNRYRYGKGVAQDNEKAEEWYRKAALLGSIEADVELGNLYCTGFVKATPVNWAKVASVWKIQAENGDACAQNKLGGMCYRNGYGVPQDGSKAVYWLEKAAAQGENKPGVWDIGAAMWGLSRMYSGDRDLPRNDRKAFYWAEKSAQYGTDSRGMVKLAELYAKGIGTPKDRVKAEEWAQKAAAKGNTGGLKYLEKQ